MNESCANCRFSAPSEERLTGSVECRRRPPTGGGRRLIAEWPIVGADSWCGEYEQRPAKAAAAKKAARPTAGETETREQG